MAMNDEERLIQAVKRALKFQPYHSNILAEDYVRRMRAEGITLTPPPAPEPTYTIRLTDSQRNLCARAFRCASGQGITPDEWSDLADLFDVDPDPEPGT